MRSPTPSQLVAALDRAASPFNTWLADLHGAWAVWRRTPVLPLTAIALAVVAFLPNLVSPSSSGCGTAGHPACTSGSTGAYLLVGLLSLPVTLFGIGFYGAERWWYAQVGAGTAPSPGMLWRVSWAYFWRYVRLGLVTLALFLPVLFVLLATKNSTTHAIAFGAWALVIDIAFTFVTPALAFSTDSALSALRIGASALKVLWPRDWVYALVPPMALAVLTRLVPHALGPRWATAVAGAAAQLLTVLFAGAAARLYLRELDPEAPERLRYGPSRSRPKPNNALDRWRADEPSGPRI